MQHQKAGSPRCGHLVLPFLLFANFGSNGILGVYAYKNCPSNNTIVYNEDVEMEALMGTGGDINGCLCSPEETTGLYGEVTSFQSITTYRYNLYTKRDGYASSSIVNDVLPLLEPDFSRAVLVYLFPEECSTMESSEVGDVVGLSTFGVDKVVTETCDEEEGSNGSRCFTVDGQMTIYLNEPVSKKVNDSFNALVKRILSQGGVHGDFLTAHQDIERISFQVDDNDDSEPWYLHAAFLVSVGIVGGLLVCVCIVLAIGMFLAGKNKVHTFRTSPEKPVFSFRSRSRVTKRSGSVSDDDEDDDAWDNASSDEDNYSYDSSGDYI